MDRPASENSLISVVAPLYNEEKNVPIFVDQLSKIFEGIGCNWELVLALDPSTDRTREVTLDLMKQGHPIRLLRFARRIGKPLSVIAGLDHARGDACIIMDVDLQDPPALIKEMVQKWKEGFKVVIAQRVSRKGEHPLYLWAAELYYKVLRWVSQVDIPENAGDYRLLDAQVVQEVRRFRERHGFLRGITAAVGFPTALIPFDRDPRLAGKTQISFLGAVNIALDGIVPFSRVPARFIFVLGLVMTSVASGGALIWLMCGLLQGFSNQWPLILLCFLFPGLTGIVLVCLGIVGEYVLRAYEEARNRPLYAVAELKEAACLARKGIHREE
jgi:glycosyltransferase involved in cell wall biosynthesis